MLLRSRRVRCKLILNLLRNTLSNVKGPPKDIYYDIVAIAGSKEKIRTDTFEFKLLSYISQ